MKLSTKERLMRYQKAKYGNSVVKHEGETFHSKGELNRYLKLRMLEKSGYIQDLQKQVTFELQPSFKLNGKTIRALKYVVDFTYIENGKLICEDFKGFNAIHSKIKQKLFQYKYKEYELRITK